jgi:hypothetical protein
MSINCGGPGFNLTRSYLMDEVREQLLAMAQQLQGPGGRRALKKIAFFASSKGLPRL